MIDGMSNSVSISAPENDPFLVGGGYRVNFVKSSMEVNTIYAQSNTFEIIEEGTSQTTRATMFTEFITYVLYFRFSPSRSHLQNDAGTFLTSLILFR